MKSWNYIYVYFLRKTGPHIGSTGYVTSRSCSSNDYKIFQRHLVANFIWPGAKLEDWYRRMLLPRCQGTHAILPRHGAPAVFWPKLQF